MVDFSFFSSQQVKAYDSSNNPEKGFQRILRVQSVKVSPLRQYKHTTDNELSSPTSSFDGNYKMLVNVILVLYKELSTFV